MIRHLRGDTWQTAICRYFMIFGSRALVHEPANLHDDKFEARSKSNILVGYCKGNALKTLLDETNNMLETMDVTFLEEDTPEEKHKIELYRTLTRR